MNLKSTIFLVSLLLISLCIACKKPEDKTEIFPFSISNFGDVTIMAGASKSVSYEIKLTGSDTQTVILSVSGLPYGTAVEFSPSSANSTFTTAAQFFVSEFLKPGNYPFSLVAKTANGKEKVMNATLIVLDNCGIGVIGNYSVVETGTSSKNYTTSIAGMSDMHLVKFQVDNLNNVGIGAYIYFDCATKTISIPSQIYNNGVDAYTITGSGTIGTKSFILNYTLSSATKSGSYTATFTKTFPL